MYLLCLKFPFLHSRNHKRYCYIIKAQWKYIHMIWFEKWQKQCKNFYNIAIYPNFTFLSFVILGISKFKVLTFLGLNFYWPPFWIDTFRKIIYLLIKSSEIYHPNVLSILMGHDEHKNSLKMVIKQMQMEINAKRDLD